MQAGRKAARGRREPVFDATPTPALDLKLSPSDRPGAPPTREDSARPEPKSEGPKGRSQVAPVAKRDGGAARGRKAANDDAKGRGSRANRRSRRRGGGRGGWRRFAYWAAVLMLWAGIAGIGLLIYIAAHLPPIQSLQVPKRPPSVHIVDVNGAAMITRGEMGAPIPLREMPKYLPSAFLAIEDRRFYEHSGVDFIGIARAASANILRGGVAQGGSTITQQLAKNLFLTQERTFKRKLQELFLAFWLEHKFTKAQILELYINRVYFGAGAYGIEAAAQRYFAKSARHLTLSEAALLAGLVKSPSRLAPTRNPQGAQKRAQVVLAAMVEAEFIAPETAKATRPAQIAKSSGSGSVNYVADWVMDVLDDLVGRFDEDLVVETTIDQALQLIAEKALVEELEEKGAKFDVEQGALIAMSPDGAVRALVGGKNYAESQFNRAIAAKRQPGSAFKPFVYLAALERGLTSETLREDRPINVKGWQPENYTREYFGAVTLRQALAMSLNTVAVRLTLEVGPPAVVQIAHRLGIASKLTPNATIALGTSEVSMLEMVTAFAPFANGGLAVTPHVVTRVRSAAGTVLYRKTGGSLGRIVEPRMVAQMNAMMRETLLTGTARKAELPDWPAAGKTGTSQEFRDAWFVGYTAHLVGAVWLGNDDSSPTRRTTGGGMPADIWSRFMKAAHRGVPPTELPGARNRFPTPPAAVPPAVAGRPPAAPDGAPAKRGDAVTLDRWLIEKVFGRH
ncbi:MAG TPA: PBP1A family penicillin-binding protein [Xanthobacteraceae bacterium]|nr:PBP1A family penicillin-binding protein [Xanthobacteraceae bacterium]